MFHVFSRYILGCELRPVSSFGFSQPLCFTVSRHDWNEAKWFQRVEDFFWGQKWSWNNKKHIDGDKLRNTPQVARNKKWTPLKQLADLLWPCNNKKTPTNICQRMSADKENTNHQAFSKIYETTSEKLLFWLWCPYDLSSVKICGKKHLVHDGLAYPASSAGLCRICETRRGGEQFGAGQWQLSSVPQNPRYVCC